MIVCMAITIATVPGHFAIGQARPGRSAPTLPPT